MSGLWDQIGGVLSNVGDIAQQVANVGTQWASTVSTFQSIGGGAQGVPPTLGNSLPPGYSPLYVTPTGAQPNPWSLVSPTVEPSGGADESTLWIVGGVVLVLLFAGGVKLSG